MPARTRYQRLARLLNPRGIAFVGGAAVELRGDIVELEANPTLLRARGQGVIAVDGVIKIESPQRLQ